MEPRSTCCGAFRSTLSLALFASSIVVDSLVSWRYQRNSQYTYFGITLGILILPGIIVHLISWKWHYDDTKGCCGSICASAGVVHRHFLVFRLCTETDPERLVRLEKHQTELRLLHLYQVFLKSAPQLAFQLYLRCGTHNWNTLTALMSLLSLCWAIIDYDISLWRRQYKSDGSFRFSLWFILHELGRLLVVLPRIAAMVMIMTTDAEGAPWLFVSNWVLTLVFVIMMKKAGAIQKSKDWIDWVHDIPTTAAFTFSFIDIGEPSFWTLLAFVYAHALHQTREYITEFSKVRWKNDAKLHAFLCWLAVALFGLGVLFITLCDWKCERLPSRRFLFPNKGATAEHPRTQSQELSPVDNNAEARGAEVLPPSECEEPGDNEDHISIDSEEDLGYDEIEGGTEWELQTAAAISRIRAVNRKARDNEDQSPVESDEDFGEDVIQGGT